MSDEVRIELLEYVGWTGLTRKGRLVEGAMRGYDPKDGVFKLAPNPTKSLDSWNAVAKIAVERGHCIDEFLFPISSPVLFRAVTLLKFINDRFSNQRR